VLPVGVATITPSAWTCTASQEDQEKGEGHVKILQYKQQLLRLCF